MTRSAELLAVKEGVREDIGLPQVRGPKVSRDLIKVHGRMRGFEDGPPCTANPQHWSNGQDKDSHEVLWPGLFTMDGNASIWLDPMEQRITFSGSRHDLHTTPVLPEHK